MIEIISKGAHWRNVHLQEGPCQFAHVFDPDDPEDVPHQAHNFMTYAKALGNFDSPFVLIGPADQAVHLSDWAQIVSTATHVPVEIR